MSVYDKVLERAIQAYADASNSYQPPDAKAKIADALNGFYAPLNELNAIIERQRAGQYPTREEYARKSGDALRVLDAQTLVLDSALGRARRERYNKVARAIVDQPAQAKLASMQKSADDEILVRVKDVIVEARKDAAEAGEISPDSGGSGLDSLGPLNVGELEKFLDERAAPKEDAIFKEQVATIGGQNEPPDKTSL